jgi:hypothetical protein
MSPNHLPASACLAVAVVRGWLFYARYWQWRDCISEAASTCITPDGQHVTSGGLMR